MAAKKPAKKPAAKPKPTEADKAEKPAKATGGRLVARSTTVRKDGMSRRFSPGDTMPAEWAEHCPNEDVFE